MVAETDRTHRSNSLSNSNTLATTTTTSSELFICFTSRLSSSITTASSATPMKLPCNSKSILSPGRSRDPHSSSQISLSTSLSRRLRSNGSLKGGQASPMFPPGTGGGKRKGCAFENPEPSSPKVTCIGQVRVKSKKQGRNKISKSGIGGRKVSFRNDRPFAGEGGEAASGQCWNGKWVYDLPLTICEGLRALGSEFNCFFPCRSGSSCTASDKEERAAGRGFCGAVFARWVVEQEEEEERGREGRSIELMFGEGEGIRRDKAMGGGELERGKSYKRHMFEEIEFKDDKNGSGGGGDNEVGDRVSICIPPKNALLLMRCRSDPVKMAALANKFFEAPPPPPPGGGEEEEEEEEEDKDIGEEAAQEEVTEEEQEGDAGDADGGDCGILDVDVEYEELVSTAEASVVEVQGKETEEELVVGLDGEEEGTPDAREPVRKSVSRERQEQGRGELPSEEEGEPVRKSISRGRQELGRRELPSEEEREPVRKSIRRAIQELSRGELPSEEEREPIRKSISRERQELGRGELPLEEEQYFRPDLVSQEANLADEIEQEIVLDPETVLESIIEELPRISHIKGEPEICDVGQPREMPAVLPDCLLLMMCEPKLSMEVSKETWVCSTDFVRCLPGGRSKQPAKKTDGEGERKRADGDVICEVTSPESAPPAANKNSDRTIGTSNNVLLQLQPPRSSCYYPAQPPVRGESMVSVIEKKLVGAKAYEPFVLTRCKSEPMKTAASKLIPQDACFWENRKLEPATTALGVGAAGVGF